MTSRTAGWMVAAALAGSLVTLGVDHRTSQPAAGPIAMRNAGRVAPVPAGSKKSWQIAATPLPRKQVYVAPGGPLVVGAPPAAGGAAWTIQPACAVPGRAGPPFQQRRLGIVMIPAPKRVIIGRPGHSSFRIQIGKAPTLKRISLARPGCSMLPLHCRPGMRIAIRRVPAFKRITVERRGRVVMIGPNRRLPRRLGIKAPAGRRAVVIVPSPPLAGSPGPQCLAFRPGKP